MLIFLAFTLYLSFSSPDNAQALPVLDSSGAANRTSFVPTEPSSCSDLGHCRTIWDIVWSCLVVIFTCNWIAIHPNIPGPNDSSQEIILRRMRITIISLIAPEFIVVWALRQWYVARDHEKKFKDHGWTMTHGFFALMGGFMLFEHDQPVKILLPDDIEQLNKEGSIDFPSITKKQIEDRSKGDLVSKGLVVVQTTWFILQCIARGVERLPVTELEIMTLAYATLNFVTYALWWYKPLNVQYSFRIYKKSQTERIVENDGDGPQVAITDGYLEFEQWAVLYPWDSLNAPAAINILLRPFLEMAGTEDRASESLRVPIYHAGALNGSSAFQIGAGSIMIATIFGGIHCIAWSFEFPSHQEQILWRASSLTATCIPLTMLLLTVAQVAVTGLSYGPQALIDINYKFVIASLVYVFVRLDLIVQAFISLRTLPPGAYETVHWTTFIPHI